LKVKKPKIEVEQRKKSFLNVYFTIQIENKEIMYISAKKKYFSKFVTEQLLNQQGSFSQIWTTSFHFPAKELFFVIWRLALF
jgi:hypothetical protein